MHRSVIARVETKFCSLSRCCFRTYIQYWTALSILIIGIDSSKQNWNGGGGGVRIDAVLKGMDHGTKHSGSLNTALVVIQDLN